MRVCGETHDAMPAPSDRLRRGLSNVACTYHYTTFTWHISQHHVSVMCEEAANERGVKRHSVSSQLEPRRSRWQFGERFKSALLECHSIATRFYFKCTKINADHHTFILVWNKTKMPWNAYRSKESWKFKLGPGAIYDCPTPAR